MLAAMVEVKVVKLRGARRNCCDTHAIKLMSALAGSCEASFRRMRREEEVQNGVEVESVQSSTAC